MVSPQVDESLPPGVYREDGKLFRDKVRESADGEEWVQKRRVALTLEEARANRWDFYHPSYGWIIQGYKRERDADPQEILQDNSSTVLQEGM